MTVSITIFRAMYAHSAWANQVLLDQADLLNPAQLNAEAIGTGWPILGIFNHQIGSQRFWLSCFQEGGPVTTQLRDHCEDIGSLRNDWQALDAETIAYVERLTPAELEEVITYSGTGWSRSGPRWEALLHQAFHQHQHRSDIAMALTNYGHSPGEIDVLDFIDLTEFASC